MPSTQQKPAKFDELVVVYSLWNVVKDVTDKIEVVAFEGEWASGEEDGDDD